MHSAAVIATPAASFLMVISHPYKDPMEATVLDSNLGPGTYLTLSVKATRGGTRVLIIPVVAVPDRVLSQTC
jgi:hypothetical protein